MWALIFPLHANNPQSLRAPPAGPRGRLQRQQRHWRRHRAERRRYPDPRRARRYPDFDAQRLPYQHGPGADRPDGGLRVRLQHPPARRRLLSAGPVAPRRPRAGLDRPGQPRPPAPRGDLRRYHPRSEQRVRRRFRRPHPGGRAVPGPIAGGRLPHLGCSAVRQARDPQLPGQHRHVPGAGQPELRVQGPSPRPAGKRSA